MADVADQILRLTGVCAVCNYSMDNHGTSQRCARGWIDIQTFRKTLVGVKDSLTLDTITDRK